MHQNRPQPRGLPSTVETCPHRRPHLASTDATCELIARLVNEETLARVPMETCTACCHQFPPSEALLNPVVASLLYRATSQPSARTHTLQDLRDRARTSIDIAQTGQSRITPVRSRHPCWYLGKPLCKTPADMDEATFLCTHPGHEVTTATACQSCRDWSGVERTSPAMTLDELIPGPARRGGRPVVTWAIGVTTSPRRQPTLTWCLESLSRAGWSTPHLFVDGPVRIPDEFLQLPVTWRDRPTGAWPAWYFALMELVVRDPAADAYMLIQDDAWLHDADNLRTWLESALWPTTSPSIVSLYSSQEADEPGWHRHAQGWAYGAVAFVLSQEAAGAVIGDATAATAATAGTGHVRAIDSIVSEIAIKRGIEIWSTYPSLVQHTGNTSTIWGDAPNAGPRCAPMFSGGVDQPFADEDAFDAFPEAMFPAPPALHQHHQQRVERGRLKMAASTAVICSLCRDVRYILPRTAARVERLGSMFADYRVIAFENDSRDSTLSFLNDWHVSNERVHVLHDSLATPRFPRIRDAQRAAAMAAYRNRYHDLVVRDFPGFDFVIVIDSDLRGGWSYDGICDSFGFDSWDFIGSYGLTRVEDSTSGFPWIHFDTWAFRPHTDAPHSFLKYPGEILLKRGSPLIPVDSCFGGLGIYRMDAWSASRYAGPDCEHVVFHEHMRKAGFGRLFLNPSQITLYSHR